MIEAITSLVGLMPVGYEWVIGLMVVILFTFVVHVVFEVIGTFFNFFGGDRNGRSY